MSSDAVKKRKSKVLRGEGATPEMKRGRVEGDQQVKGNSRIKADLLHCVFVWICEVINLCERCLSEFDCFRVNIFFPLFRMYVCTVRRLSWTAGMLSRITSNSKSHARVWLISWARSRILKQMEPRTGWDAYRKERKLSDITVIRTL